MEFLAEETSLVAVGAWNRAILSPAWIAREGFGTAEPVDFQLELPVGGVSVGAPPRFLLLDLRFTIFSNRVEICPLSRTLAGLDLAERTLRNILQRLPHTPVQGVGFNFGCSEIAPTDAMLAPFNAAQDLVELDFPYEIRESKLANSLAFEGRVLNLTRSFSNGSLKLSFNFHHETPSAAAAAGVLREGDGLFRENYGYFRRVMQRLYGENMNPLSGATNGN